MGTHEQVIVDYFGRDIEVDKGIEDLLKMIWDNGYRTYNSCKDNNGDIWIEFANSEQFQQMIQLSHTFDNNVNGNGFTKDTLRQFFEREYIKITIYVNDDGYVNGNDEYVSGQNINLSISLRFPKEFKKEFMMLWKETFD